MSRLIQLSLYLGSAVVFGVGTALAQRVIAPDPIDPALTTVTNPGKRPVFGTPTPPVSPPSTECASDTKTWSVGSYSCSGALPKTSALQIIEASDTQKPNTGKASYRCKLDGTWEPHSVSRNTCGPTDCPAESVEWTVGGSPACTGSTAKTDIGLTYLVSGTRKSPSAGSANGTFLCQTDGIWAHQDPGTDTCPKDCAAPATGTDATWDGTSHGEMWSCTAPYPTAPAAGRAQWIVGDSVTIDDTVPRDGANAQEGIGSVDIACVDVSGSATGTIDRVSPTCGPAPCNPSVWSVWRIHDFGTGQQGLYGRHKFRCSGDSTSPSSPIAHGASTSQLRDTTSWDDDTSYQGSARAQCDNSLLTITGGWCQCGGTGCDDVDAVTGQKVPAVRCTQPAPDC